MPAFTALDSIGVPTLWPALSHLCSFSATTRLLPGPACLSEIPPGIEKSIPCETYFFFA